MPNYQYMPNSSKNLQRSARNTKNDLEIYDYDQRITNMYKQFKKELSEENNHLLKEYDKKMVMLSLAKATREKHLKTILNLSRMLKKDWKDVTKNNIDDLVFKIMNTYGGSKGQESNTSYDHKKILKIFVRWLKLGSREFKEIGDPPETKEVKLRAVADELSREDMLTEDDYKRILDASEHSRTKALFAVQYEAGTRPGELLNMKIKHVKFDDIGAVLAVNGKTDHEQSV